MRCRELSGNKWQSQTDLNKAVKEARKKRRVFVALVGLFALFPFALAQEQANKPPEPVKQPVAFSHKRHAETGLQCARCHAQAETAEQAGLPAATDCLDCHRKFERNGQVMQSLQPFRDEQKPIAWVKIYDLPDFVFFSHAAHLRAKVACAVCHGPVATREALWREREVSMKACVACHKERQASTACNYCHELNR